MTGVESTETSDATTARALEFSSSPLRPTSASSDVVMTSEAVATKPVVLPSGSGAPPMTERQQLAYLLRSGQSGGTPQRRTPGGASASAATTATADSDSDNDAPTKRLRASPSGGGSGSGSALRTPPRASAANRSIPLALDSDSSDESDTESEPLPTPRDSELSVVLKPARRNAPPVQVMKVWKPPGYETWDEDKRNWCVHASLLSPAVAVSSSQSMSAVVNCAVGMESVQIRSAFIISIPLPAYHITPTRNGTRPNENSFSALCWYRIVCSCDSTCSESISNEMCGLIDMYTCTDSSGFE